MRETGEDLDQCCRVWGAGLALEGFGEAGGVVDGVVETSAAGVCARVALLGVTAAAAGVAIAPDTLPMAVLRVGGGAVERGERLDEAVGGTIGPGLRGQHQGGRHGGHGLVSAVVGFEHGRGGRVGDGEVAVGHVRGVRADGEQGHAVCGRQGGLFAAGTHGGLEGRLAAVVVVAAPTGRRWVATAVRRRRLDGYDAGGLMTAVGPQVVGAADADVRAVGAAAGTADGLAVLVIDGSSGTRMVAGRPRTVVAR